MSGPANAPVVLAAGGTGGHLFPAEALSGGETARLLFCRIMLLKPNVLVLFAGLETALGFCAGCFVFGYFIRWGLVPATICAECEDFSRRVQ